MRVPFVHLAASLLVLAGPAFAGPSEEGAAARPDDPRAHVPPLTYMSPFARYRPFAGGGVGPWSEMNDEVARIGGWKAYAREAFEASKQAAPPPDVSTKSSESPEAAAPKAR